MSEIKNPEFDQVKDLLGRIDLGEIECLNLHGPGDEKFCMIARPGFYQLTIFVDENKGYAFSDGSEERSQKIEIAGNYWPSFRVCKNKVEALEALQAFFYLGTFPEAQCWIAFSDDQLADMAMKDTNIFNSEVVVWNCLKCGVEANRGFLSYFRVGLILESFDSSSDPASDVKIIRNIPESQEFSHR